MAELMEILQLGEMIELELGAIVTRTKVEEIVDAECFWVSHPTHQTIPIYFEDDENVLVLMFRENGVYSFTAAYVKRMERDGIRLCQFKAITPIEKNQRRFSYRLPIVLNATVHCLSDQPMKKNAGIEVLTMNLSVEGTLFNGFTKFQDMDKLLIVLQLAVGDTMTLQAEVLRSNKGLLKGDPYQTAVRFIDISKRDQTKLSKYIINKQIAQRNLLAHGLQ